MKKIIFSFLIVVILFSCGDRNKNEKVENDNFHALAEKIDSLQKISPSINNLNSIPIKSFAIQVWKILHKRDFTKLEPFVLPEKGIRFSSVSHVSKTDLVFSPAQMVELLNDKKKYTWRLYNGQPMKYTFEEYTQRHFLNADSLKEDQFTENAFVESGITKNNVKEFYPGCRTVDISFKATEQNGFMDGVTSTLVFEEKENKFYLVGIVYDGW